MSGTSVDGVDGVLAAFDDGEPPRVLGHVHRPFPPALAAELVALNTPAGDELHRAALAANGLVTVYAEVVDALLAASAVAPDDLLAIGAHGQTVRHRPGPDATAAYTLQINNPAWLAERCGIDVVADFRSRDIAAGGQGAPLVPAFHRAVFGRDGVAASVLNLGGIANLTLLGADGSTRGFDCGPANVLMDAWCQRHTGQPYDAAGAWAAGGQVDAGLLAAFQREPYFATSPPKSTGRDLFNDSWLAASLASAPNLAAVDVQATLAELTAWCCADAWHRHGGAGDTMLVCGGGALNALLMRRLAARLPGLRVQATDALGLPCQQVEAAAFAWLAWRFIRRQPGNLAAVTGARGPRVLGALYPAAFREHREA